MPEAERRPRLIFLLVPAVVWVGWLALMASGDRWALFQDNWFMTVTMCLGSFVAGATSEGGGAVAFPVMTLLFDIHPGVARDFSLMIQSVGMTAATILIICYRVPVEWRAVLFAGAGGTAGVIIGLEFIAPHLPGPFVKVFFTSLWLSFAVALFWINRERDRVTNVAIRDFGTNDAIILGAVGVLGGAVSGLTGSGLDIMTFTLLTLLFRMSEKIATPTSVVLMALNAVVGFAWRGGVRAELAADAWNYWYVCIPVVVIGAPLGAYVIRQRTRRFIAGFLYASIVIQFVAALIIIPQTPMLIAASVTTIALGVSGFGAMAFAGARRLART